MRVRDDVPLGPLTTLQLGGLARRLIEIDREDDVPVAVREADRAGEGLFVLGQGSNVVVGDDGFAGTVARIAFCGIQVRPEAGRVAVDVAAGENWDGLVARAVDEGWSGVECMSGIPGLAGAAPVQNVGAYGQEVKDTLRSVRVFDRQTGAFVTIDAAACGFGYRASVFKRSHRYVVTSVRFVFDQSRESLPIAYAELSRALAIPLGARAPLRAVRDAVVALRRTKGMLLDPGDADSVSAGSFFVNPVVDDRQLAAIEARAGERPPCFAAAPGMTKIAAAWLVERAGFPKGFRAGPVGVSRKHALALVNRGGGTARALVRLAHAIRDGVRARFGVGLEPEPVFVGCSWDEEGL